KNIATIQPIAELFPRLARIAGGEHAAIFLVAQEAGINCGAVTAVHQQGRCLAVGKAAIGSSEGDAAIVAQETPPRSVASSTRDGRRGSTSTSLITMLELVRCFHVAPASVVFHRPSVVPA